MNLTLNVITVCRKTSKFHGCVNLKNQKFAFRSWEQRSFKEMMIQRFFISCRVEKLKNKRIRILRYVIGSQMPKDT